MQGTPYRCRCGDENCNIPYGYCHDGCGEKTELCPQTVRKINWIKGEPKLYIFNHHTRKTGPKYEERDLGYRTPCWLFLGYISKKGYGNMRPHGSKTMRPAHVAFYEAAKGPVPQGKQLDHLCHDPDKCPGGPACLHRRCVNPDHLLPSTPRENSHRGQTRPGSKHKPGRKPKPKLAHCKRGHDFTPENTIIGSDGGRRCRICDNASQRRAYYKRAARAGVQPQQRLGPEA